MMQEAVEYQEEAEPLKRPRRKRHVLLAGSAVLAVAAVGIWSQRVAISDGVIRQQFEDRGISASYQIEEIGLRSQRLTNLTIGPKARPDLAARRVDVQLRWGWTGPIIEDIRADGVRVRGAYRDGALTFGDLDKFSDPTSKEPFLLPDFPLTLHDARLALATPWGAVGVGAEGKGHLRNGFAGHVAAVAPKLQAEGCEARDATFQSKLDISNARPHVAGPLAVRGLRCASQDAEADAIRGAIDLRFAEDFLTWGGTVKAEAERLRFAGVGARAAQINSTITSGARTIDVTGRAALRQITHSQGRADNAELRFTGDIGSGQQMFDGSLHFSGAQVAEQMRKPLLTGAGALDGTPLGPLLQQAARAGSAALINMQGVAKIAYVSNGKGARINVSGVDLQSASGARLRGDRKAMVNLSPTADGMRWSAAGQWRLEGGGLPQLAVEGRRSQNAEVAAVIAIAPYQAGGAALALAPLTLAGRAGQSLSFQTEARFSGPLADGRVEGAVVPLAGSIHPNGDLAIRGGCHVVRADWINVAGYQFDKPDISLCSASGADLIRYGQNGLSGEVHTRNLELRGRRGDQALQVQMAGGSYRLNDSRFAAQDVLFKLSPALYSAASDTPTHFAAKQISGQGYAQGLGGRLEGAEGRIGAVPLNMSEIAGDWRWANGALTLDGQIVVTDAQAEARFRPLISRNARLVFANQAIKAKANFVEREIGRDILTADIVHRFGNGGGRADLNVPNLRFDEQFQPSDLTRLALGVVAEVQGSITGNGFILWGDKGVTSGGTFSTVDTNLAAAFGPVVGLTGTMVFDDLLDLKTRPKQTVSIREVNPGIAINDGVLEYSLIGGQQVRIEGGRWPLANGELILHPTTLNFSADETRHLSFDLVGIDAAHLLQRFEFENLNVSGTFDGSLPVEFDGLGGRVVDGRIDSRAGGGLIEYVGELSNRNLGAMANFAFGALRSLTYDDLSLTLNGNLDGEMVTDIRFGGVGQGAGATQNFFTRQIARIPMVFNVKVMAPFRSLFTTVKGLYDPSVQIEEKLPELFRQQNEVIKNNNEPLGEKGAAVQPSASGPVQ